MRSNSPESVDDAPDDEDFKGSDEKSAKAESVRYAKVRRDERNKHNAAKGLVEKTCQISNLEEGALGSYMHPATDMKDGHNDSPDPGPALTTDRITEFDGFNTENNMGRPGSNQKEEPDSIDKIKPLDAMATTVAQPAQDANCNDPDSEQGLASRINKDIDTNGETDQVEAKEESEVTDDKETRSYSLKTVDDTPDDEILRGGDTKPGKSESVGHAEVREDKNSKHDAFKDLIDEPCEKTYLKENTLEPHMHPASDIENDSNKNLEIEA